MNFLNKDSLKLMYHEIFIMIAFLCGCLYMLHAVLNFNLNAHGLSGVSISYYYIFPFLVTFLCFSLLLYKFISIYRLVIRDIHISDGGLVFTNLVSNVKLKDFSIFIEAEKVMKKWTYWEGVSKKHINFIIVEEKSGKRFILPYKEAEKDLLIQFLIKYGGIIK